MKNKKIGIMGGTFDPIHNGHLFIAEQVRIKYNLDKVLFIPSGRPPHKDGLNVSEAIHRYNMVNLAIASNDYFFSSLIEIDRKGNTYTIDTLKQLKTVYLDSEIYFIVGYDTIETIHTWKDYELLDCSDGERLERWGKEILVRPDPQATPPAPRAPPRGSPGRGRCRRR